MSVNAKRTFASPSRKQHHDETFRIAFDPGETYPNHLGLDRLMDLAMRLREMRDPRLSIAGHANVRGDRTNAMRLARRRVRSVCNLLLARGIDATRLGRTAELIVHHPTGQVGTRVLQRQRSAELLLSAPAIGARAAPSGLVAT